MKPLLATVIALLMSVNVSHAADPLAGLQGKSRPVLLFAKSRSDASLDKQVDLFHERRSDLRGRDMVVLRTAGNEETRAAIGYVSLPEGAAFELRRRFEPRRSGLTVVLIGKDGTEKARWERLAQPQEIFELIDSMPMRQREMEEGSTATN